jgi:hypothetical protein
LIVAGSIPNNPLLHRQCDRSSTGIWLSPS